MTAILFAPDSGNQCAEFQREAKAAASFFGGTAHLFPASRPDAERRKFVLDALAQHTGARDLEIVAFLCHGHQDHIQAGFYLPHVRTLASAIGAASLQNASVPLYCCSTGKGPQESGEGSFADALRDSLVGIGMRGGKIFAHTSAGHLSRNPDARVFEIRPGEAGGLDICPRSKNADAYRRWRGLLHTQTGRWEIATMSHAEIEAAAARCEPYSG